MRHLLEIAYEGTRYLGWQRQAEKPTIQQTIEHALAKITQHNTSLHASGRTDAGVHATGQTAHVDLPASGININYKKALNAHLPPDIRILCESTVPDNFHARFSAIGKEYHYQLLLSPTLLPSYRHTALHHSKPIDLELLQQAAQLLTGTHDFAPFAANRGKNTPPPASTTRILYSIHISKTPLPYQNTELLTLRFHGNGFLYKMVRLLTGALLRVATQRETLSWLKDLIKHPNAQKCPYSAPAHGLTLHKVFY